MEEVFSKDIAIEGRTFVDAVTVQRRCDEAARNTCQGN